MKRTLAGVALVAAVLLSIALTSNGKPPRGRFGFVAGIPAASHENPNSDHPLAMR